MSFIYTDENLISELLKSAIDFESKFNKKGQVAQNVNVNAEYKNYLNLSSKLVDQLTSKLFPKAQTGNQVESAVDAGMTIADMNTMGNFFEFVAVKKILVNGARPVYAAGEVDATLDKKKWLPVNAERSVLAMESLDEDGKRSAITADYYVNKDLITKYINSLQAQASKEDAEAQRMMKALLNGLIDKINQVFGTKISTDYKEPEKTLPNDTVLSTFPQVLDAKLYTQDGPVPLTWGDIQSADAIKGWVNSKSIAIKVEGRQGGPLGVNHPEFDFCIVARTIYGKATALQRSKPDPEKIYANFVKKIGEVGQTLTGPDNKPCTLGGGSGGATPGNQPSQAGELSQAIMEQIAAKLPFAIRDIDFNRINRFFDVVSPLLAHDAPTMSHITGTKTLMDQFSDTFMAHGDKIIPLSLNINQFANMMKDKEKRGSQVYGALSTLNEIVDNTRTVLDALFGAYGSNKNFSPSLKAYILGQIGKNSDDSSIYLRNARDLERIRRSGTPTVK